MDKADTERKTSAGQRLLDAAEHYLDVVGGPTASVSFSNARPPVFVLIGTDAAIPELLVQAARRLRQQRY